MKIILGAQKETVEILLDNRIKEFFIYCSNEPMLCLKFNPSDFVKNEAFEYAEKLGKKMGGVNVNSSLDYFFIHLSEFKNNGEFLRII